MDIVWDSRLGVLLNDFVTEFFLGMVYKELKDGDGLQFAGIWKLGQNKGLASLGVIAWSKRLKKGVTLFLEDSIIGK